jgi:hypothetical protein
MNVAWLQALEGYEFESKDITKKRQRRVCRYNLEDEIQKKGPK